MGTNNLIYSNMAKPGSKVVFQEKVGKLNKETIGFSAGHHIPFGFYNLLKFKNNSILKPNLGTVSQAGISTPCVHSYFLITRIGKTGKFRFQLLNVKLPIFNGEPFKIVKDNVDLDLDISSYQSKLLETNKPLILNYHDNELRFINNPPFVDVVNELDNMDFLCWVVSRLISLKVANLGLPKGSSFHSRSVFPELKYDMVWSSVKSLSEILLRHGEKSTDAVNSVANIFESHNARINTVFSLQQEFCRNNRILIAHLQNLLGWSFAIHRNLKEMINSISDKEIKTFKSHEKKLIENYNTGEDIKKLDLFLSRALVSIHPMTKETKNKDKQKVYAKINKRFL